jgi:2-methylisocitrate lyase-like PEP mutase family enzyme
MAMGNTPGSTLKAKIKERRALLVPGAANALSARIIQDLGFEALYITGAGVTNMYLGIPDLGFISLPEIANHTSAIRDAVDLPIIVDADTGFGNSLNVQHTVRVLERAGANCIQLEDQAMPKKCGHFAGKDIISAEEAASKIKAAVDARKSEDFLILARTDARAKDGFQAAVDRCQMFIEAGADITFLEAPESMDEIRKIPELLACPQLVNMVIGGKTPIMSIEELRTMKFSIVLYANAALQGAISGMQAALGELKKSGKLDEKSPGVANFNERQRLVQKPVFDALEKKYAVK